MKIQIVLTHIRIATILLLCSTTYVVSITFIQGKDLSTHPCLLATFFKQLLLNELGHFLPDLHTYDNTTGDDFSTQIHHTTSTHVSHAQNTRESSVATSKTHYPVAFSHFLRVDEPVECQARPSRCVIVSRHKQK